MADVVSGKADDLIVDPDFLPGNTLKTSLAIGGDPGFQRSFRAVEQPARLQDFQGVQRLGQKLLLGDFDGPAEDVIDGNALSVVLVGGYADR